LYVVIVYDAGVERIDRIRVFLKQYLDWVQNSVFEGELTKSEFVQVKSKLKELIDEDYDSILFYHVKDEKYLGFDQLGTPKANTDSII
jgi:CRISPR-associated protein Cas2